MTRGTDAAGIVVVDEERRVLLVRQTYNGRKWSLPGGMVDEGESAWAAARRELQEEAGVTVGGIDFSGIYYQGHKNRYIYTFRADGYIGDIQVDNDEIDQYGFFSLDELPRPMTNFTVGRIKDALTNEKTVFRDELIEKYEILE